MKTMTLDNEYVTRSYNTVPTGVYETDDLEALFADAGPAGTPQSEPPQYFFAHETVEIELPSEVRHIDPAVSYLVGRAAQFGIVCPQSSNLPVALNEALANAINHGNGNDPAKRVRLRAEFSAHEALFTVSDEGRGFNLAAVSDPREAANLLEPSGRGLLLIHQIMDKVVYHGRGNAMTMIKYPEAQKRKD